MNDDPQILEDAMQAAAVLGAALARFQNSVDRLRKPSPGQIAQAVSVADPRHPVWNRYGTEGTDYDPDGPAGDSGG